MSSAIWPPTAKRNIVIASLARSCGDTIANDLRVEIYAMRELQYQKPMRRERFVESPFVKLARRTAGPPAGF